MEKRNIYKNQSMVDELQCKVLRRKNSNSSSVLRSKCKGHKCNYLTPSSAASSTGLAVEIRTLRVKGSQLSISGLLPEVSSSHLCICISMMNKRRKHTVISDSRGREEPGGSECRTLPQLTCQRRGSVSRLK